MTHLADVSTERRTLPIVDAVAPPERLATLRILTGTFALVYLLIRLPAFLQLADRRTGFDGVGLAALLHSPLPGVVVDVTVVLTLIAGLGFALGWRFRITGALFAFGMLALGSYRSSWGQLLHFENLMVLYLLILALSPSADVWSLDARRRPDRHPSRDPTAYGWPIALASLTLVATYVIAGVAKLRYGGFDWVLGGTLRNHVDYAAARLDLLGGTPSPFARTGIRSDWLWSIAAAAAIVIELAAPVAFLGDRVRTIWVVAAWMMHVGILALMLIGFPMPLFLVAFAPLYRVERIWTERRRWWAPRRASPTDLSPAIRNRDRQVHGRAILVRCLPRRKSSMLGSVTSWRRPRKWGPSSW